MRYFLLLSSFCIVYIQAFSQVTKQCTVNVPFGSSNNFRMKGCLMNGVCWKYGSKVNSNRPCSYYMCERRGRRSFVRYIATGCFMNGICYTAGRTIDDKNDCVKHTCTNLGDRRYEWETTHAGCKYKHGCYPVGSKRLTKKTCLVLRCKINKSVAFPSWDIEEYGCLEEGVCRRIGWKEVREKECIEAACVKNALGYTEFQKNVIGCKSNTGCQRIGTIWREDECWRFRCDGLINGSQTITLLDGCVYNNKCYPFGVTHLYGCFYLRCKKIGDSSTHHVVKQC
ncbi:uncharacterized protein LOC106869870 [Octopus bimaculoides]|uniref:Uncharacterized protein n=1 Tax=Octopus bimaculoides TaxID=37653 RepID=A0A0L8HM43_OCTBM|nr:uncharacterized protein LOC106869870 [Octopus bimaculoides]|eukprot:XP_014771277.1 PREDICTED: uncharacterized protein LOC106869870 [Octopus bimaculoides]